MKFKMNADDLKYLMNVCKFAIDKSGERPAWQMIHCNFGERTITGTTLDGYRMHRVTVPCDHEELEGKECFLPFIKVPSKIKYVIVEVADEEVTYDFLTEKKVLKKYNGEFPNISDVIPKDEPQFEISADPKYLKDAMDAFKSEQLVTLQFYGETKPIIVKSPMGDFALIMPKRNKKY